jgi:tetratricopeptide (TPR) repeat protein
MACQLNPPLIRRVAEAYEIHSRSPRRAHIVVACLIAFVGILMPSAAWAHGDVHEAIVSVTREIEAHPDDPKLHLRRGELHRAHQDWVAAGADFDKAQELDATLIITELLRGEMLADAGRLADAMAALDRFLKQCPDSAPGFTARARVHAREKRWTAAADDFGHAIEFARTPNPELFIERAQALRAAGRHDEALATLDAGVVKLGALITLTQLAIDCEVEAGRLDAALARLAKVVDAAPRKERWLFRRGELLEKAGRSEAAHEAYTAGQAALAKLPPERRATAAMEKLAQDLATALTRLASAK